VYKRRWYILITYSLFAMSQNGIWNTWGPISASSEEAFGWHDSTIAWLNNWGPVAYILLGLFYPWLLQVKGLRWAVVSSMLLLAIGAGLRCITSQSATATILIHAGHFFVGAAGPIAMGAIPTLSAIWFPPRERVTATALGSSIGVFGVALSFVLGPALVTESPPKNHTGNTTGLMNGYPLTDYVEIPQHSFQVAESANVTDARIRKEKDQIMRYMYYEGVWSLVLFLVILIYYPAKPPTPPCVSAVTERDEYWSGLWSLRRKGYFLVVALVYGISLGVVNCWSSVLYVNLKTINISEDTAGWIGFYSTIAASFASLLIGRFANHFARRMKLFILVLYTIGTGCFLVFTLMLIKIIPYSDILLWATIIGGTMFVNAAVPLMFELACELAYPTSEGAANGVLTYLNNVGGLFFLLVFSFPHVGTMWMNWVAIGSCLICIPLIGLLKGRFNRLEVDEGVHTEIYVEQTLNVESYDNPQNGSAHRSVQAVP
ncbi:disrupted in renal carcinoma protein 2-like protein, partial [Plakobranchus ocellatus]